MTTRAGIQLWKAQGEESETLKGAIIDIAWDAKSIHVRNKGHGCRTSGICDQSRESLNLN
jgi:hypothetical protein